jgi:hypothetical protein
VGSISLEEINIHNYDNIYIVCVYDVFGWLGKRIKDWKEQKIENRK